MGRNTKDFKGENVMKKDKKLGETKYNNKSCLMKIIGYNNSSDIIVEFQDEYKTRIHTTYNSFIDGKVRNPYHPSIYNVGITGNKYTAFKNGKHTKEYIVWKDMLKRCYDDKEKGKHNTYKNVACCNEWLLYENFYEWLHSQENFDKWLNGDKWALDKDILIKGNKIYSPETCCLVPQNVNKLFLKRDATRGDLPIGVKKCNKKFGAQCTNPFPDKHRHIGYYDTPEQAFQAYKEYKEAIIKQVAQIEYNKGNITQQCKNAMLNYIVEITD